MSKLNARSSSRLRFVVAGVALTNALVACGGVSHNDGPRVSSAGRGGGGDSSGGSGTSAGAGGTGAVAGGGMDASGGRAAGGGTSTGGSGAATGTGGRSAGAGSGGLTSGGGSGGEEHAGTAGTVASGAGSSQGGHGASGGAANAGHATGGAGDAAGNGGEAPVACGGASPSFPDFDRSCSAASDCTLVTHTTNCCGEFTVMAIDASAKPAFTDAETTCDGQYPGCGCAVEWNDVEDGTEIYGDWRTQVVASCDGGACKAHYQGATFACGDHTCTDQQYCGMSSGGPVGVQPSWGCVQTTCTDCTCLMPSINTGCTCSVTDGRLFVTCERA